MASAFDINTDMVETYRLHQTKNDGAAVFMAMIPKLLEDTEFDEHFTAYCDERRNGYPDLTKAVNHMAILCDNVYRRVKDEKCGAHVKVSVDKSGNVLRVSQGQLDAGNFAPKTVIAGEFQIFAKNSKVQICAAADAVDHKDFVGKYQLSSGRKLSVLEESLLPKLQEYRQKTNASRS